MPSPKSLGKSPRKVLHVFYVLDTSGSMEGKRIAELNKAMGEITRVLSMQAEKNADAVIKIAVLEFNSGCQWVQPEGPEEMEDFIWDDLIAGGMTDIGKALKELDDKLSEEKFLKSSTGTYLPVIIFMTDGFATDNYKKALERINKNKWFAHAIKIGFAIGDNPDVSMIAEVVGDSKAVIYTRDLKDFANQLEFVTATASRLGSVTHGLADECTGSTIVDQAVKEKVVPIDSVPKDIDYIPDLEDIEDFEMDDFEMDDFYEGDFTDKIDMERGF